MMFLLISLLLTAVGEKLLGQVPNIGDDISKRGDLVCSFVISKEVLKYISSMQTDELKVFLDVIRKINETAEPCIANIQAVQEKSSRLPAFSYLGGACFMDQIHKYSSQGIYLHKLKLLFSNGDVVDTIHFSIRKKTDSPSEKRNGKLIENNLGIYEDIITIDEYNLRIGDDLSRRDLISHEESYYLVPWEYMLTADAAYCVRRREILKQCLMLLQENEHDKLKELLDNVSAQELDVFFWGFSFFDSVKIANSTDENIEVGISKSDLLYLGRP